MGIHNFSIHSPTERHLLLFHLGLLWIEIPITPRIRLLYGYTFFSLGVYLWVELLGCVIHLCWISQEAVKLFSKVSAQFSIPTRSTWWSLFLYFLAKTCHCGFFLFFFFFLVHPFHWVWSGARLWLCIFIFSNNWCVQHLSVLSLAIHL